MCLTIDESLTKKGLKGKRVYPNGMYKVWKVLIKSNKHLQSPFYHCFWKKNKWNKSNRISKDITPNEVYNQYINLGIHVFLTRKEAREYKMSLLKQFSILSKNRIPIVFPGFVKKEDLVAVGKNKQAVFTKVFLPPKSI